MAVWTFSKALYGHDVPADMFVSLDDLEDSKIIERNLEELVDAGNVLEHIEEFFGELLEEVQIATHYDGRVIFVDSKAGTRLFSVRMQRELPT